MDEAKLKALRDAARAIEEKGFRPGCACIQCHAFSVAASPDTILEVLRELEVLRQTLQVAHADCPIKQLRQSRLAAWRAQAERELEEKHGE
jgi:hypothetical protein